MARKKKFDFDDERPWTEEQWEAFMIDADNRSARFGELLETLHNDPERDLKIEKEMGWDKAVEGERDPAIDEMIEAMDAASRELAENPHAGDEEFARMDREVEAIAAYQVCMKNGDKIHRALTSLMKKHANDADDEIPRLLGAASIGVWIGSAKISGGHAMGTEDEQLCGNIVNCKRGLRGIIDGRNALDELLRIKVVDQKLFTRLSAWMDEAKSEVESHIAEMRSRVWWDK